MVSPGLFSPCLFDWTILVFSPRDHFEPASGLFLLQKHFSLTPRLELASRARFGHFQLRICLSPQPGSNL